MGAHSFHPVKIQRRQVQTDLIRPPVIAASIPTSGYERGTFHNHVLGVSLVPEPFTVLARIPAGQITDSFVVNIDPDGFIVMAIFIIQHDIGLSFEFMPLRGSSARDSVDFALIIAPADYRLAEFAQAFEPAPGCVGS